MKERCWKKIAKGLPATTNFLEGLVDDEEATLAELNHVCGDDRHVFFGVRIPTKKEIAHCCQSSRRARGSDYRR